VYRKIKIKNISLREQKTPINNIAQRHSRAAAVPPPSWISPNSALYHLVFNTRDGDVVFFQ